MPWNEPGGNQQDPWTGKNRNAGKNQVDDLLNQLNKKLNGLLNGGKKNNNEGGSDQHNNSFQFNPRVAAIAAGVAAVGWLFTGFYTVDARQQALELTFGAYTDTKGPGLRWHVPYPVETYELIDVAQNRSAQDRNTMLTKDENIIDIAVNVQYRVKDAEDYAFNVFMADSQTDQIRGTLYQAMRSATREVIGRSNMDFILGDGREQIALEAQKLVQSILDRYGTGLQVIKVNLTYAEAPEAVKDAFDDANRAREDANRFQNEAETYANKVIPEARGQAARLLEEANAYRDRTIARAEGDAARFSQLATEYNKAPVVTRERLYLETMETVLGGTRKVIVDGDNNVLYLPLPTDATPAGEQPSPSTTAPAVQQAIDSTAPSRTNRQSRDPSTTRRESR